jgi:pimeloyl-ACP methyl ester carboxylesterase
VKSETPRLPERGLYPQGYPGVAARFLELRSGLRVRVIEAGNVDDLPIVFVPGLACGGWIFHDALPTVAACGFRAIAVELKGHGLSDKPTSPAEYTLQSMSDHLIEVFDALGLRRTGLVGHSMGAAIAAHAANVVPERVTTIVLAAPVGFAGVRGMGLVRFLTPAFALSIFPLLATRLLIRGMLAVVYGSLRRPTSEDVEEFHAPTRTPGATTALRHLLHEFEWNGPFPALPMPLMTIVGSEDILSPQADLARYTGGTRDNASLVIEGAGHVLFDEAPEIVNAALCEFFTAHHEAYISNTHD